MPEGTALVRDGGARREGRPPGWRGPLGWRGPSSRRFGLAAVVQFGLAVVVQFGLAVVVQFGLAVVVQFGLAVVVQFGLAVVVQFGLAIVAQFGQPLARLAQADIILPGCNLHAPSRSAGRRTCAAPPCVPLCERVR